MVAAHNLAVGAPLGLNDLTLARLDLPGPLADRAFSEPGKLVGATVLGPVSQGELVQAGSVGQGGRRPAQVSFSLEAARALNGRLADGEQVDVLATYGGSGGEAYTEVVARRVPVGDVATAGSAMGNRTVVLTLSLEDPAEALAVAHAVRSGNVTIVRAGSRSGGPDLYRPGRSPRGSTSPQPASPPIPTPPTPAPSAALPGSGA